VGDDLDGERFLRGAEPEASGVGDEAAQAAARACLEVSRRLRLDRLDGLRDLCIVRLGVPALLNRREEKREPRADFAFAPLLRLFDLAASLSPFVGDSAQSQRTL